MKKLFLVLVCCIAYALSHAQISDIHLRVDSFPDNNPYAEAGPGGFPLPFYAPSITIDLSTPEAGDTIRVIRLHVSLGSSTGGDDIFSHAFELDEAGVFLQDNSASITTGAFKHTGTYYATVKAEMSNGSFSDVYEDSGP